MTTLPHTILKTLKRESNNQLCLALQTHGHMQPMNKQTCVLGSLLLCADNMATPMK